MLEPWLRDSRQADGRRLHRCTCDVCGERGEPVPEERAAEGFHEFDRRVHLCEGCFAERGSPWVLWYTTNQVQGRQAAINDLASLRGDPHVAHIQSRDLLRAMRGRQLYGVCLVFFREGHDRPADPALHPLHAARQRPPLSEMIANRRAHPNRDLQAELEHVRTTIMEALQVELPDVDLRPGTIARSLVDETTERAVGLDEDARARLIRNALSTSEGRSSLAAAMANPIRARMDYTSAARRTFMVDPLPEGALPVYLPASPAWPDWAVENNLVYRREDAYRAYRVTAVTKDSLKLSEVSPSDDNLALHFVYSQAEDLDAEWSSVLPPTAWERLLEN